MASSVPTASTLHCGGGGDELEDPLKAPQGAGPEQTQGHTMKFPASLTCGVPAPTEFFFSENSMNFKNFNSLNR